MEVNATFPEALQCLFQPSRYKVLYGGRGGSKSWGAARALLMRGASTQLRVLCAREYQNSISESVHKLLSDQITSMGLDKPNDQFFYIIQRDSILGSNGTEFVFIGIKQNIGKLKSYEGIDVCWVEEAQSVSKHSWDVLVPTIRKPGSEIWMTFNPDLESDETYQRFVLNPPPDAIVKKITWKDNPFFPDVLRKEMEDLKRKDYDSYLHVWEGNCKLVLDGAIYAKELRAAQEENRITSVPYDFTKPVDTFWDLGFSDMTSIWFAQAIGYEFHLIDFYQNSMESLEHYLQVLQKKNYTYGTLWLPHDAKAKQLGTGRSIEELARAKGFTTRIVPRLAIADGINAARTVFPRTYIDQRKCADGLQALRKYKYETLNEPGEKQVLARAPLHDENSHAADAFRYFGVSMRAPKKKVLDKFKEALGFQSGVTEDEAGNKTWEYQNGKFPQRTNWMKR